MTTPIPYGDTETFVGRFTLLGVPVTDATGTIYIYRLSDGKYWDGDAGTPAWVVARTAIVMTEISETQQPGDWKYDFDTTVGLTTDQYIAELIDSSGGNSDNVLARQELKVGSWVDEIIATINRSLALQHDNFVMDPLTYDANGSMVTGVVRAYDSAANATTDDEVTGLLYEYAISGERTSLGYLAKFTQTRVT